MNREMNLRHRRAARTGQIAPGVRAEVALVCAAARANGKREMRFDDASGMALEVGQVEHWGHIEHIDYGNHVNEFEIGGGNAFGPDFGYDWTGAKR